MILDLLKKLVEKKDLTVSESEQFLLEVMKGGVSPTCIASILVALRMKGESVDEIVGFLRAMRANMLKVNAPDAIDIVGTGGDGSGTFNISTTAAFVVAGVGVKVAKHGNRAASSKCGSADVLEALGVNIQLTKEQAEEVFKNVGLVFMMAPLYHPAMKEVAAVREELKIRTVFNVLGPFANPASTQTQLTGVPNKAIAKKLAEVGKRLGYKRLLVVSSNDGMDEISLSSKTHMFDVYRGKVKKSLIDPKRYGFKRSSKKDILGGDATENAAIIRAILSGGSGAQRDVVVFNSAFALYAAGAAASIQEGIEKAKQSIDSGSALRVLESLIRETQNFA
ncbi:MAG: anthranilate phosphoribosyltransferase [Parcubacteria group bacterium Gr01-1014_8]|nr:MAG: anthranilate phosphoribosyltransferase [Parcubacteria group bacterium Gr01-1014_8]